MVNCVVMTPSQVCPSLSLGGDCVLRKSSNIQANAHEEAYREGKRPEEQWGSEVTAMVGKRRTEAQEWLDAVM